MKRCTIGLMLIFALSLHQTVAAQQGSPPKPGIPNHAAMENHGPHAGYVQPGIDSKNPKAPITVNSELLVLNEKQVMVYLIDNSWGDIDLKDTKVVVTYVPLKGKKANLTCTEKFRALTCELPKDLKWNSGDKVSITRSKKGQSNLVFEYIYPFKHGA